MKAVLTSPLNPISPKPASHRGAQGTIYADMIRQSGVDLDVNYRGEISDYSPYDAVYVYHGNDFSGALNLFGGLASNNYAINIKPFSTFTGKVYSLGIPFPPYHSLIGDRIQSATAKGSSIAPEWLEVDLDNLKRMYETAETCRHPHITNKIVVGDSHAICMYRPGWIVNSIPFKTLNGILNDGLSSTLADFPDIDTAEFYFGNIDIRHHLCRLEGSYIDHTKALVERYVSAVEALPVSSVAIYEPLPIEHPSRRLPKTGYYKGRPFTGSWEERNKARTLFIEELDRLASRARIIRWTESLTNEAGELRFDAMEKPGSVHLSRESYPHWTGIESPAKELEPSLESFFA